MWYPFIRILLEMAALIPRVAPPPLLPKPVKGTGSLARWKTMSEFSLLVHDDLATVSDVVRPPESWGHRSEESRFLDLCDPTLCEHKRLLSYR